MVGNLLLIQISPPLFLPPRLFRAVNSAPTVDDEALQVICRDGGVHALAAIAMYSPEKNTRGKAADLLHTAMGVFLRFAAQGIAGLDRPSSSSSFSSSMSISSLPGVRLGAQGLVPLPGSKAAAPLQLGRMIFRWVVSMCTGAAVRLFVINPMTFMCVCV